jgi:hypothetical protein
VSVLVEENDDRLFELGRRLNWLEFLADSDGGIAALLASYSNATRLEYWVCLVWNGTRRSLIHDSNAPASLCRLCQSFNDSL